MNGYPYSPLAGMRHDPTEQVAAVCSLYPDRIVRSTCNDMTL